jgi:hypothetical protein
MLYNGSGTSGGVWGSNSYSGSNYGHTTVGTSGYAGTGYTGGSEAIDI